MASGSGSQQTNPFPIRWPRSARHDSPYPPNPPTHACRSSATPDSTSVESARTDVPFTQTTTSTALQENLTELKMVLRTMKASMRGLPPLKSAIGRLEWCLAHIQIRVQAEHEYGQIVFGLTSLANLIQKDVVEKNPSYAPQSIANVARAIEEQSYMIRECQNEAAVLEHCCAVGALLQQLQVDISLSTWDVSHGQQTDNCLERLLPVYNAYHNAAVSDSVTKRTGCTEGTRVELLTNIQNWIREEDAAKIYWLNGMAGTGKTTIAYSVCEMLLEKHQLGGSFFCSRNSPDCRNVNRIVPTIAYQLGRYSNPYRKVLCDVLRNDPDAAKRNISTQFKQLISGPLAEMEKAMPADVVVVIDALDECSDADGTRDVLQMLLQHAGDLPIKFFVSTRPEPEIDEYMISRGGAMRSIMWLHDIERSLVQADIRVYLAKALEHVQLSSSEVGQLAEHAGCLFIFAATAVRYILPAKGSVSQRQRLQVVLGLRPNQSNKSHQDIDVLYSTILASALDGSIYEDAELTARRQVLWTVVCAREPLSISSVAELLGIPDADAVQVIIQPLQSVLHVSDSTNVVSALHASFPDFLLNEERAGRFRCDGVIQNSYLAGCCFRLMSQSLKFNICDLESSYQFDRDVPDLQDRIKQRISRGLFYSCRYWGDHMIANPPTPTLFSLFESFLQQHLLFWMEVLHLKGQIGHGGHVLSQVLIWLSTRDENTWLQAFTHDARNFLTIFAGNPSSLSTPHLYVSVLPFTPKQSLVHRTYWPRTQGLIRIEEAAIEMRRTSALANWHAGDSVNDLALSKDGRHVVSGSDNNTVSVWDISSGTRVLGPLVGHEKRVWSVAYSPDGTRIASGSEDGTVRVWHAQTGESIAGSLHHNGHAVYSVAFSPDGAHLASGSFGETVRIWDGYSGAPVGEPLEGHQGAALSIAFSPNGRYLASGLGDNTIRVWNWQESVTSQVLLEGHAGSVYSIAYSTDGHRLASGSKDRTVRVWDMSNGTLLAGPFEGHTYTVTSVAFSPNGSRVVSGSRDGSVRVWDAVSGMLLAGSFEGHGDAINSVLFTADGTRILSGSDDDTIRVWDARHRTAGATEPSGHIDIIHSVAVSSDGRRVASGSGDETICVWDTHSGALVAGPFTGHTSAVTSVGFSPDGARIVSGSYDRTLRTWDASTGTTLVGPMEGHTHYVHSVAFSPDGIEIASGSYDHTVRLWNSYTGASIAKPFRGHTSTVTSIAFSPGGSRIVSGSWDMTVRMWDANDGTMLWASDAHTGIVSCVAFSPDGMRAVSGSYDHFILVLNATDGTVLHGPLRGHTDIVYSVAFSPVGTLVVSGSEDKTVRVWDVERGTMVAGPLNDHRGAVYTATFSPDGARIISGSADRTIRVWDLAATAQTSPSDEWSIDRDGWLTNSRSQRLFWVPSDLRDRFGFLTASNPVVINASWITHSDPSTLLLGDQWHKCYDVSLAAASSKLFNNFVIIT